LEQDDEPRSAGRGSTGHVTPIGSQSPLPDRWRRARSLLLVLLTSPYADQPQPRTGLSGYIWTQWTAPTSRRSRHPLRGRRLRLDHHRVWATCSAPLSWS